MKVKLISSTPDAEKTIGYIARVSNPNNQDNPKISGLLKYCIKHQHWSIFEQANLTLEIETTRAIAAQILRHRSFTFQEFSQRYADSSLLSDERQKYEIWMQHNFKETMNVYKEMLADGVAKECARMILPLAVPTRLYMTGTIRSWMHYIELRTGHGTQKEHMEIAEECKKIFVKEYPIISEAMEW